MGRYGLSSLDPCFLYHALSELFYFWQVFEVHLAMAFSWKRVCSDVLYHIFFFFSKFAKDSLAQIIVRSNLLFFI